MRAGAINASSGASKGAGVSAALIWSGNKVEASVNDGVTIEADKFDLVAKKSKVTFDDYRIPLTLRDLVSDTSNLTDEERKDVQTGLFDVHKQPGEASYTIDVHTNTTNLMKALDMVNQLGTQNYYTEAIAGSLVTGVAANDWNMAGSISVVRASNVIKTILGNNVTINKRSASAGEDAVTGVNIEADGRSSVRLIGGALSVAPAQKVGGATVTFLYDKDNVEAKVGNGVTINSFGDVNHSTTADTDVEVYNAAVAVNTSAEDAQQTLGGGVDIIILNNSAKTLEGSKVTAVVGSVEHPMLPAHYIEWIALETETQVQFAFLKPEQAPKAVFTLPEGETVQGVYAYCNLHSLWKA